MASFSQFGENSNQTSRSTPGASLFGAAPRMNEDTDAFSKFLPPHHCPNCTAPAPQKGYPVEYPHSASAPAPLFGPSRHNQEAENNGGNLFRVQGRTSSVPRSIFGPASNKPASLFGQQEHAPDPAPFFSFDASGRPLDHQMVESYKKNPFVFKSPQTSPAPARLFPFPPSHYFPDVIESKSLLGQQEHVPAPTSSLFGAANKPTFTQERTREPTPQKATAPAKKSSSATPGPHDGFMCPP